MPVQPDPSVMRSGFRSRLETTSTVVFILTCLVFVWTLFVGTRPAESEPSGPSGPDAPTRERQEPPLPTAPISLEGAVLRGSPSARLALIEYSDFECPFCARFSRDTLPILDAEFVRTGHVLLAFRHLPLPIHAFALKAAEAAECAGAQGQFWQMHDALFENPKALAESELRERARAIRLDITQFSTCLSGGAMAEKVQVDIASARVLGIAGTPAFLIGVIQADGSVVVRQRISGARPVAAFRKVIGDLVSAVQQATDPAATR